MFPEKLDSSTGILSQGLDERRLSLEEAGVSAPLMSFVLVNWNYARYIGQTIDSIRVQDYEKFECVIVDNGSDDDSLAVIERHVGADPRFRVIGLPENRGQLGAAFVGIRETSGPFLAIIDSDDVLFPTYASVHLQVHLALPNSVGFTSSNAIEIDGLERVLSSGRPNGGKDAADSVRGLKEEGASVRIASVSSMFYNATLNKKTTTLARSVGGWLWFPGTSNVYRRSMVELFLQKDDVTRIRSVDGYLLPFCHALGGSALIDYPLSAYRIHGSNNYAKREVLGGVPNETAQLAARNLQRSHATVAYILDDAERFNWLAGKQFWSLIDRFVMKTSDDWRDFYRTPQLVAVFKTHAKKTLNATGRQSFIKNVFWRLDAAVAWQVISEAYGGKVPIAARFLAFKYVLRRHIIGVRNILSKMHGRRLR